ncbi:MAG: hypothetical protein ACFFD4_18355 [Candidatus Odinarchaeota archaeon]
MSKYTLDRDTGGLVNESYSLIAPFAYAIASGFHSSSVTTIT